VRPPLCRSREHSGQPLQVEQPSHEIGFVSDLQEPASLKAPEAVPAFRLPPEFFDLFARPLREPIAHRPTQAAHSLMERLPARRLGRNVGPDTPPDARRQKGFREVALIGSDRLKPHRVLLMERIEYRPSRRPALGTSPY